MTAPFPDPGIPADARFPRERWESRTARGPRDGARDSGDARVVPLYALAHRARPRRGDDDPAAAPTEEVPWEAMVTATRVGLDSRSRLQFEQAKIVDLCQRPVSVAEVAAHLRVPVGVARLLVAELRDEGMITAHVPRYGGDGRPSGEILDRLLAGLRSQQGPPHSP